MPDIATLDAAAAVRRVLGVPCEDLEAPGRTTEGWDDERVIDALVDVEALARQVEAWRVALATEVERRSARGLGTAGMAVSRGCRNARELLRRVTGAADASVSRWLRVGRATEEPLGLTGQRLPAAFPRVAEALAQGRIGLDAASRIIDTLSPVRRTVGDGPVAVAEDELVSGCAAPEPGGVCPVDADSVRVQAATWAAFLDQDGTAPPEGDLARRSLRLGGLHRGLVRIQGLLMPEVAAALRAFADSCTNPRTPDVAGPGDVGSAASPARDGAAIGTDGRPGLGLGADGRPGLAADGRLGTLMSKSRGDSPSADSLLDELELAAGLDDSAGVGLGGPQPEIPVSETRTSAQLMHDVLAAALGAAARVSAQSSLAGNSPTVLVAVRQEDLAEGRGTAAAFTGDAFGAPAPVSIDAARQLACAGAIQRVVLDDLGAVVGLGSAERRFTGQQRRAIVLRDGGCVIPGCHVPASWCEVHHVTAHADGGSTHTDNGCLLCWFHHRTIETSGWEIRMRDGVPEVRAPEWLATLTRAGPPDSADLSDPANPADLADPANPADLADPANPADLADPADAADPAEPADREWRRAVGSPTRFLDALRNRLPHGWGQERTG